LQETRVEFPRGDIGRLLRAGECAETTQRSSQLREGARLLTIDGNVQAHDAPDLRLAVAAGPDDDDIGSQHDQALEVDRVAVPDPRDAARRRWLVGILCRCDHVRASARGEQHFRRPGSETDDARSRPRQSDPHTGIVGQGQCGGGYHARTERQQHAD